MLARNHLTKYRITKVITSDDLSQDYPQIWPQTRSTYTPSVSQRPAIEDYLALRGY